MEQRDVDLINKVCAQNEELKSLWDEHVMFEKQLERLEGKPYLTPQEDTELKEIKKKKLAGKTKIQLILDRYRSMEA